MKRIGLVLCCVLASATFAGDVSNGMKPAGKPLMLTLTPELTIHGDGSGEFIWGASKTAVVANGAGMIYVMDPDNHKVLRFSPEGKLLNSAGSLGEGPGEFQSMSNLSLRKDGSLSVFEQRNGVHVYTHLSPELELIEQKKVPAAGGLFHQAVAYAPDADVYTSFWIQFAPENKMTVNSGIWSSDHEKRLSLYSEDFMPFNPQRMTDPAWWSEYLGQWFATGPKQAVIVYDNTGGFYHASTHEYKVTRYDRQLKKTFSFDRKYKPKILTEDDLAKMVEPIKQEVLATLPSRLHEVISDKVVKEAMENADFKPVKQPIFGMLPMPGHLLVFHDYDVSRKILTADIFTDKGVFVGTSQLPPIAFNYYGAYFGIYLKLHFQGDKAYGLATNEAGDLNVVRYSFRLTSEK